MVRRMTKPKPPKSFTPLIGGLVNFGYWELLELVNLANFGYLARNTLALLVGWIACLECFF